MSFFPIWIAEALFTALFIVAGHPISTKKGFVFKMIACALFFANGMYAFSMSGKTEYGITVLVGLAAGWIGDVFLALDPFIRGKQSKKLSTTIFLFGGAFFLIGHFAYITAFARLLFIRHAFRVLPFVAAWIGICAVMALAIRLSKIPCGKLAVPIAVYAVFLGCMFALAVCAALLLYSGQTVMSCILIGAAALFVLSDVTLAIKSADRERFGSLRLRIVCLAAYFLAQMLFGVSIMLQ
ncbi:MAG: hypothetical protein IJT44_10120 [Clostridia bacterium]|nr:hypothetical protein [Clostridia bacterium]